MGQKGAAGKGSAIARIRAREERTFAQEHGMCDHERQLDDFFEKLYFHEIDTRDKLAQRLQLPLVTLLALAGFVGHMLQNVQHGDQPGWTAFAFWCLTACAGSALLFATYFFARSIIGKTYKFLPLPDAWRDYHQQCVGIYQDHPDKGALVGAAVRKNLIATYIKCASANGETNAEKSARLFKIHRCLVVAALATFATYGVFYFGKLDKNLLRSIHRVEITNPLLIERDIMTSKPAAPPPPPPPPIREIREDRGRPNPPNVVPPRPNPQPRPERTDR